MISEGKRLEGKTLGVTNLPSGTGLGLLTSIPRFIIHSPVRLSLDFLRSSSTFLAFASQAFNIEVAVVVCKKIFSIYILRYVGSGYWVLGSADTVLGRDF